MFGQTQKGTSRKRFPPMNPGRGGEDERARKSRRENRTFFSFYLQQKKGTKTLELNYKMESEQVLHGVGIQKENKTSNTILTVVISLISTRRFPPKGRRSVRRDAAESN